jgi:glycerol-3-phosphate acyltransferase PlsX
MGSVYMEKVLGIAKPRIGLLNIGEEEMKGNELTQEVFARLQETGLNFVGNVEADRVHQGNIDVLVTDGFTGNVAVKATEGAVDFIFSQLRESLTSRLHYKIAAAILRPALMQMRSKMDYGEYGGAPLLGVDGVVIVAHGRADAQAIKNGLRLAEEAACSGMLEALHGALTSSTRDEGKKTAVTTSQGETTA